MSSDLTIEVPGRLPSQTLVQDEALRRLWRIVVELDLCETQHEAMRRQLCGDNPGVLPALAVEGSMDWTLDLRRGARLVMRVSRPGARSPQQRIGDRYVPVQLPGTSRCPGLWAVQDTQTGRLVREVEDDAELRFGIEDGARGWIARQSNLAGYQSTRSIAAGGAA
ncbi:hypothetical protein [Kitasatospora sp. NPDC005751]|uniref:hypothetical protein n=1 Tax=Kitasatospora sp. NPDC005751 TaxID=3157064 RepID=UPI0033E6CA3D